MHWLFNRQSTRSTQSAKVL